MESKKVIILGAVAAGSKVASKLKRDCPNFNITIYTKDNDISYSACAMPYYIGNLIDDINELKIKSIEEFEKEGTKVNTNCECIEVLPHEKNVVIKDLISNNQYKDSYDILVIATGAKAVIPKIEGVHSDFILPLRNLENAQNIKEKAKNSKSVTIIGGGYIGTELIENFRRLGLSVNVIDFSKNIMNIFDEEFSKSIQKYIEQREKDNVKFFLGETIEKFEVAESIFLGTKCRNAGLIKSDFVVLATGIKPNTEFLKTSGIELNTNGTIKVDEYLQTNIPDIYACGDCADKKFCLTNKSLWVALGTTANKEARIVAQNIAGKNEKFNGITSSSVTKYFDLTISCTGLNENNARLNGFDPICTTITKEDKPSFMPDVSNIHFKLIVDKKTHKVLGAEALGSINADKSVNIVSSAISAGMTVEELSDIDITYAPPVSATIDVLTTAAWKIKEQLD